MSRGQISRWALHEAGADYDQVVMDWGTRPESFRAINPMNKVPALVHHHRQNDGGSHDHVITECAAINHYLAETHPDKGLLPDSHGRAAYFRWLFFAAGPLEQAVISKAMGWEVSDENGQMMAGFGTYDLAVGTIEGWLKTNDFAAGTRFTMADTYLGSQISWGVQFGTLPKLPAFEAYAERVTQRPAYAAASAIDAKLIAEAQNG